MSFGNDHPTLSLGQISSLHYQYYRHMVSTTKGIPSSIKYTMLSSPTIHNCLQFLLSRRQQLTQDPNQQSCFLYISHINYYIEQTYKTYIFIMQRGCNTHNKESIFKTQCLIALCLPPTLFFLIFLFVSATVSTHRFSNDLSTYFIAKDSQIIRTEAPLSLNQFPNFDLIPATIIIPPTQFLFTSRTDYKLAFILGFVQILGLFLFFYVLGSTLYSAQNDVVYLGINQYNGHLSVQNESIHENPQNNQQYITLPQAYFTIRILIIIIIAIFVSTIVLFQFFARIKPQYNLSDLIPVQQSAIQNTKFYPPTSTLFPNFPYYQLPPRIMNASFDIDPSINTHQTTNQFLRQALASLADDQSQIIALNYFADTYGCSVSSNYIAFSHEYAGGTSRRCQSMLEQFDAIELAAFIQKIILIAIAALLMVFTFFCHCKCAETKQSNMRTFFQIALCYVGWTQHFDAKQTIIISNQQSQMPENEPQGVNQERQENYILSNSTLIQRVKEEKESQQQVNNKKQIKEQMRRQIKEQIEGQIEEQIGRQKGKQIEQQRRIQMKEQRRIQIMEQQSEVIQSAEIWAGNESESRIFKKQKSREQNAFKQEIRKQRKQNEGQQR